MKYVKKPIVVEAVQFNKAGDHPAVKKATFSRNGKCVWCEGDLYHIGGNGVRTGWYIPTLEGGHEVTLGDYIITGIQGEQYPCKPDIFHKTYDLADF